MAGLLNCGLKERLKIHSAEAHRYFLMVRSGLKAAEFIEQCRGCEVDAENPDSVLLKKKAPRPDKYDYMVPEELLRTAFLKNRVNIPAALESLRQLRM